MTKTARNHAQTLALQNAALVQVVHRLPEGKIWAFTPRFPPVFGALLEHCDAGPCSFLYIVYAEAGLRTLMCAPVVWTLWSQRAAGKISIRSGFTWTMPGRLC